MRWGVEFLDEKEESYAPPRWAKGHYSVCGVCYDVNVGIARKFDSLDEALGFINSHFPDDLWKRLQARRMPMPEKKKG